MVSLKKFRLAKDRLFSFKKDFFSFISKDEADFEQNCLENKSAGTQTNTFWSANCRSRVTRITGSLTDEEGHFQMDVFEISCSQLKGRR